MDDTIAETLKETTGLRELLNDVCVVKQDNKRKKKRKNNNNKSAELGLKKMQQLQIYTWISWGKWWVT